MAKKYENLEKVLGLLDDKKLGGLQKRLSSTEKNISEILKKLALMEAEKAEREAAEAAARAAEEARLAAEEAARIAAEEEKKAAKAKKAAKKEAEAEPVAEQAAPVEEEKPKKRATRKKTEEPVESVPETETQAAPAEEKTEAPAPTPAPAVEQRTFVPKPAAPRAPRYFKNGQEQGVYVAKPGVDTTSGSSTYRPRPQGDRTFTPGRPSATGAPRPARPQSGMSVAPTITPVKEGKNFSAPAKKKTFEKTYTEKKPLSKRTLIRQQGMTVEDFDEDKSGYRKVRSPKKQKRQEIQTIKIEHAVVTTQDIPLK
ncbi:MAG: hypothetical protein IKA88_05675, partial [Clostridia bacterium]|nr:hypothetical protein [Clostridia bacterium]